MSLCCIRGAIGQPCTSTKAKPPSGLWGKQLEEQKTEGMHLGPSIQLIEEYIHIHSSPTHASGNKMAVSLQPHHELVLPWNPKKQQQPHWTRLHTRHRKQQQHNDYVAYVK